MLGFRSLNVRCTTIFVRTFASWECLTTQRVREVLTDHHKIFYRLSSLFPIKRSTVKVEGIPLHIYFLGTKLKGASIQERIVGLNMGGSPAWRGRYILDAHAPEHSQFAVFGILFFSYDTFEVMSPLIIVSYRQLTPCAQ